MEPASNCTTLGTQTLNSPGVCRFKNAASSLKTPGVFRRNFAPTTVSPFDRRNSLASSRFAHHADKGIGKISHQVAVRYSPSVKTSTSAAF